MDSIYYLLATGKDWYPAPLYQKILRHPIAQKQQAQIRLLNDDDDWILIPLWIWFHSISPTICKKLDKEVKLIGCISWF